MVPLEDAVLPVRRYTLSELRIHVLVMRIPNPRERTRNADVYCEIRDDSHNQHGIVVLLVVDEDEGDPEDKPCKA